MRGSKHLTHKAKKMKRYSVILRIMSLLGYMNVAAWGLIMTYSLIRQWYVPNNAITFYFNTFGEAFIEYIMGLIMLPCTLYHLCVTGKQTWGNLEEGIDPVLVKKND